MAQVSREGFERNRTYNYVRRTPEQLDAGRHIGEEPRGLLGSAWDNLWGGMEGMVGGLADTAGTMLKAGYEEGRADERGGLLGKWLVDRAIDLNQHAAENARRSGVRNEYSDMGILDRLTSPSYLFDPRGLTAEVSNMTGSMIPFMLMSAAMPEFGAAGVTGLIGRGLSRIGANKIAGLFEPGGAVTGFLRDGFRWAPTGVADAMSNAGEVAEEMRRQGYTNTQIADRIGSAMSYELPYDVVSQILFGGFLGGKGVRKFAEGGGIGRNIAANTVLGGFEALNEAGQEFVQTQAVEQALGKPVGTFMNPTDEERRAFDAAFIGTLPMVAAGGARNVTKNWLRGKVESAQSELQSSAPVKTSGDENIDALIAQAAEKYGVPVNLLHSIAQTESGYNQGAKSEAGAIGMMQLMPDTAAGLGVDPNDLAGNIEGGAKYLREMLDTFDDDVEKAVAAYNAGPNAVKQHGGIPPFEETQDYVRKVMGGLDGYDASVPQRVRSLLEDATPFLGVTMDNGENGCVEAVTKIGAKSCPFLAQELSNGVVNVDRLVADAGNNVIPFDPNQLEEGDVIVYGDESDPQRHVVLYDGKGGYIGNSTEQNKVVQGADYNAMGAWAPTKIIKTGAQFGGAHSVAPVMPDFTGLIADEINIKETQEAIQKLIDTDTMTPEQHAAILQAAEMARDTPIGSGTDPAAEAESVNEWQRLIDRKDAKGIFEKDPKRIVQHLQRLEKTQKMQRTRAAIENQQQIEATKQALATVQQAQNAQAVPTQGDASVQQIVPEQIAQPMLDGQVSPTIQQAGDMQGANAAQMSAPIQPENVMQNPQVVQGTDGQVVPQNIHVENVFDAPVPQNVVNSAVPTPSEALATGIEQAAADAQPMPQPMETQANMDDVQQAIQQREAPLLSIPAYVQARQNGDLNAAAQIAQHAGANDVAQLYGMLLAHRDGQAANVMPYAPQQNTPQAAVPVKAPVPIVGVRPNVPAKLPDNLGERRALGISLNKFMTDNKLQFAQNGRLDLVAGRGQAIRAADKKITVWEENRAAQEQEAAKNRSVNPSEKTQEGVQDTQNDAHDRMLAQRGMDAQNGAESARGKSAQNQGERITPKNKAKQKLRKIQGKEIVNKETGIPAVLNAKGINKMLSNAAVAKSQKNGYTQAQHLEAAENIKELYENATLTETAADKKGDSNIASIKRFSVDTVVDNEKAHAKITVKESVLHGHRIYSVELEALEKPVEQGKRTDIVSSTDSENPSRKGSKVSADYADGLPSTSTIPSEAEESKENRLSDNEREAVKGLSADAKNVYQMVRDKLSGMKNKKVSRAASAGAVLLARHADIIARKVRATLGTPFTAMDYYRTWFDLQYGEAEKPYGGFTQKQVETQKDAVRKQYEGTAYWMKAPNGADTNLTEDQWLAVRTPAFKAWFGDWENDPKNASKVIDENGEPKVVYHGTKRKDRVGSVFRKDRATSGPMAFFTDLYDIAENYSRNKQDTSIDNPPYEEQFRIKNLHGDMPLHVKWRALSPAKQQEITEKASHVTQDDDGNIVYDEDIDYGIGNFKYEIKEFRGNAIRALEEGWLNGGTLFGEEERFLEVLKLAGVEGKEFEGVFYTDPNGSDEGVFHVFMDMKKPFDTSKDITKGFMRSFRAAAKKAPKQQYENGVDFWDKNALEPMEFVERVERDIENGTTHAWTAIPDWVTALLQKKGYDGIRDTGGKNGGVEHTVYIPFESNQIKSVDNNGAFSPNDVNIFNQSAWHGSPHDFDGFDLGAIGTGEGGQAHGWGLYFAQERSTSEGYRKLLATKSVTIHLGEKSYARGVNSYNFKEIASGKLVEASSPLEFALSALALEEGNVSAAITRFETAIKNDHGNGRKIAEEAVRILRENQSSCECALTGSLFEVEIPDDDVLLDEQKTFDEQPKFVQEKLKELYLRKMIVAETALGKLSENNPALYQHIRILQQINKTIKEFEESVSMLRDVLNSSLSPNKRKRLFLDLDMLDYVDTSQLEDSYENDIENIEASRPYLEEVLASYEDAIQFQKEGVQETLNAIRELSSMEELEPMIREALLDVKSGQKIYETLSNRLGGDKAASLALNKVGIKGITYDGRRDGRCFVIFDDKAISIIEKFNQQMNEIVKGTTQDVRDGQRIVSLFEEADESTFLHEMGHLFLLDLERLADMSPTSAQELQTVKKWAAWGEGQTEEYKGTPFAAEFAYIDARIRAAIKRGDEKKAEKLKRQWEHERFARGFELYLKHGEAPTKGLRAVFAKFRAFLQRVYQAFTGTGGRATAEVEAVMARMIAMEEESIAENIENGKKAMQTVVATHQDVPHAMERSDVGVIDFVWGDAGKGAKFKKGRGIAHILAKHVPESGTQLLDRIVETIARGEVVRERIAGEGADPRLILEYNGYIALLSTSGNRNSWLLSGWETYDSIKKRASSASGEGDGSTVATATAPMLSRRDGEDALSSVSNIAQRKEEGNKKPSPMSDAHSPERNVQNDSAKVSSISNIPLTEVGSKQEPTLEEILQLAPALKKTALEYGAKEGGGKVTFADETRKQEFLKIARALLGAGERKFSKAWTGSVVDYDTPSLDYIDTGVGNAAYGYGLYYAKERKTAENYGDKLYHAEIPDADVLLDADKSFEEQPPKVRKALEKLVRGMTLDQLENWNDVRRLGKEKVVAEIIDVLSESDGSNIYGTISDLVEGQKEASELLNKYGIKGTVHNDKQSGRIFVIFDDKAIKILEKFSARRQESMKEMLDGIRLIPPTRVSPRKRVLVDWGREMGVPVVFFKGDPSLHGFHQDGVTFLNMDGEITPQWTFWHEAMHWMKSNNPDIYSDLVREIRGAEGFTKKQLDAYRKEIGAPNMSNADVIEEMLADALPDVKRRIPLLRDIGKRDTGLVQRLVAWIHSVMRRFHDHFYTPKGGLTSLQRRAMVRAFGNLVLSIRDAEGKPIFRVGYEGARIILHDKSPLPDVKYSLDNGGRSGDNEDRRSASIEARNQAITDSVISLFRKEVDSLKESGLSEQEITRVLGDEHSDLRTRVLAPWLRQYNQFQAKYPDKRGIVNRIEGRDITDRSLSNEEISRRFDIFKTRMERMMDDAGLVYAECAHQRASRSSFVGFHSWKGVEQSIREHGGSAEFKERPTTRTKTSLSTKHLEQQGAFSMPKFSANTEESRKGNFKWLTGAIRSFVGVAPADNLELPGRPTREQILSPKELERRIKERWIQAKNIISQEKQPDGKIKVTYYPDTHDVGYADWIKSVRQVAKRNPFVKILYDLAHKAMKKQEHLRNEFGKALNEFSELVKNEEDLKSVTAVLWQGDAEGKAFSDAELRAMGKNERVIKAYRLVRRELEKAYKMLRDAQTQVKTRSQTLEPESVESFKKNHWIEDSDVISAVPRADGTVLLTWRGGRTYDVKGKTITAEELKLMQEDENINVTYATPIQPTLDDFRAHAGGGLYKVNYVERIKPIFRRTGYMPHFFHEWMIYEKYKDPQTGEVRYTSVASGRTMNEAVKVGNEIAAKNKDKQYVLRPRGFDLGVENSVVIGDMDFAQMSRKLAESTEISLADARSILLDDAGASLKSRHRFFGSLLERKDGKGFDQDVMWVLAHYFNGASRYIAMEEFKPAAISMYERFFGAFDRKPPNLTAKYCQDLINDVNGNPRGVEVWLNDLIKKTWLGKHVADSYGDRVALAINGELSTWNAITKLGLGNFASAAVNFSQFINVGAALNDYGYAMKGLKKALNPSVLDEKIIEASGLLDDINMADDNGGYTQRRGGKVRGIYSAVKKGGEWTLIPFQKADTLMRKAAVLGAYYQGVEQKGMKTAPGDKLSAEALAYAQEINDDANFDYSSANAPNAFRLGSVVTQQLFQFQKYPIMQFEFMYNILKNGTRGQKVRMFVPYVIFCGIGASIPFGSLFNQLFSFLFGLATGDDEDIAQDIKAEVLRWAGKDPVKKAIAETALYGILAPTFGLDISGRIGMSNAFAGEFYGEKPDSISGVVGQQLGGPMAVSAINMLRQAHEGNPIEALKALSPALGNMAQAWAGESRTTRHRVNARYDTAYDKIAHALGFRSVDESNNTFIMNYEYEQKSKQNRTKQEAIQDYLDDPSDANRRTINALGITERQIKEARIQQERTALERATEGRPNTSRKHRASQRRKEEAKRETLYDTLDDE